MTEKLKVDIGIAEDPDGDGDDDFGFFRGPRIHRKPGEDYAQFRTRVTQAAQELVDRYNTCQALERAEDHDHGCCDGSWTHSLDCANSTDPWAELANVKDALEKAEATWLSLEQELADSQGDRETALGNWTICLDQRDAAQAEAKRLRAALVPFAEAGRVLKLHKQPLDRVVYTVRYGDSVAPLRKHDFFRSLAAQQEPE